MTSPLRQIGVITRPHGLRGEVKVRPETDDPGRFETLESVYIGADGHTAKAVKIVSVRFQTMRSGTAVVLTLSGVTDRDGAEALAGEPVWASEAELPPLDEDEVFLSDLVGREVADEEGAVAGVVADVLDLPAQPVLVVHRTGHDDLMVPFVHDLIAQVTDERIVFRAIEGLLDPDRQVVEG